MDTMAIELWLIFPLILYQLSIPQNRQSSFPLYAEAQWPPSTRKSAPVMKEEPSLRM